MKITTNSQIKECYWASSDENVVTVNESGILKVVGFGTAKVCAIAVDGSESFDICTIIVPEEVLSAEDFVVTGILTSFEYTGEPINVQIDVVYRNQSLMPDIDYTVTFSELIEPGKATLTISGINEYSGTKVIDYEILATEEPEEPSEPVSPVPSHTHTWEETSCKSPRFCTICEEWLAPLGHQKAVHEGKAESCTTNGWERYVTCSKCDYTTYKEIPATGHSPINAYEKSATCTETGLTDGTRCATCDAILSGQEVIPALGHDYNYGLCMRCDAADPDWTPPTEPTEPAPTEPTPTEPAPTEPIPTEPAPSEPDPTEPAPTEPLPTEPQPTDPAPTEPIPTEPQPTDPTPGEPEKPIVEGVTRLAGDSRYETSFAIANEMKEVLGIEKFDAIILANSDNFADALAGSYLAAVKEAPIIIGKLKYAGIVCDYVNNNLAPNGTVYVLGGEGAVPEAMLSGITVTSNIDRLAGDNRYDTNLAILAGAGVAGKDILVATGQDFADSLSASATGLPILLVNGKPGKTLSDAQKKFLASVDGNIYIIGGKSAVPASMVDQIEAASGKTTERIAGNSRYETSVKIAEQFLGSAESAVVAYASTFPDGLCGGPLAYAVKVPLILTKDGKSEAPDYTKANAITSGYVLGGSGLISDGFVQTIFQMTENLK